MPATTVLTPNVGEDAYASFTSYAKFSYNCIAYLMDNNELVWKLLAHTAPTDWELGDLTHAQKAALVYRGEEDASLFHVFLDIKQPDVFTKETSLLRIAPYYAQGRNRTLGTVEMSMEVFCHNKVNHLSNYQTRTDTIVGELLNLFNGANIGGLGLLTFDKLADQNARMFNAGQIPFGGKQLIFSTMTG
jgi:hypothetical protein